MIAGHKKFFHLILGLSLTLPGVGQAQTILKAFEGGDDGKSPVGTLVLAGTTLYGTTRAGGSNDRGTVFKVNTDGTGFAVLKQFSEISSPNYSNDDGALPESGLVIRSDELYGTTPYGGAGGAGTVFKLKTDGTGFTVLKAFPALIDAGSVQTNADGARPYCTLAICGTKLYGTTSQGGGAGNGTVFTIDTEANSYTVLKEFPATPLAYGTNSDGAVPMAGVTVSADTLYGTTYGGGTNGYGTVFKLKTNGTEFAVLKDFASSSIYPFTNTVGAQPRAAVTISGVTLYGTTSGGGEFGTGTLFKMSLDGGDFVTLKHFTGVDGETPLVSVVPVGDTLYGATYMGGNDYQGVLFSVKTNGSDYTLLWQLGASWPSSGENPSSTPIYCDHALYGTTEQGPFGGGMVYRLELRPALTMSLLNNEGVMTWKGDGWSLECASELGGVYTNMPNATSPYTNSVAGPQKFFRLRANN